MIQANTEHLYNLFLAYKKLSLNEIKNDKVLLKLISMYTTKEEQTAIMCEGFRFLFEEIKRKGGINE